MGWAEHLLDDVRRNRSAYHALFAASLVIAVFVGTYVLAGALARGAAPVVESFGLGIPFVAFPIAYAALIWRLLRTSSPRADPAPQAT